MTYNYLQYLAHYYSVCHFPLLSYLKTYTLAKPRNFSCLNIACCLMFCAVIHTAPYAQNVAPSSPGMYQGNIFWPSLTPTGRPDEFLFPLTLPLNLHYASNVACLSYFFSPLCLTKHFDDLIPSIWCSNTA